MKPFSTESLESEKWKKINMQKAFQKSGLCNISYATYSEKRFTQIYKALSGDTMFVSLSGAQTWLNMATGNQQEHLFLSFPTQAWILRLRNSLLFLLLTIIKIQNWKLSCLHCLRVIKISWRKSIEPVLACFKKMQHDFFFLLLIRKKPVTKRH